MENARLTKAIRAALAGTAGAADIAAIVADAARQNGVAETTIDAMTTALQHDQLQRRLDDLLPPPIPKDDGFLDADNLPPGICLLKDIAHEIGVAPQTIRDWIKNERMDEVGRAKGKGSGKNGFVVVREADVLYCRDNPRKGGRPRKPPCA